MRVLRFAILPLSLVIAIPAVTSGQLVSQSELTPADADPTFDLTLDHLSLDSRWLGLSPRQVTWSPDGQWVYFRWREDPASGQHPETDSWYAVNRMATEVRVVPDAEIERIPSSNVRWSRDGGVAAWSRDGTLFAWDPDQGTRAVYTAAADLGDVSIAPNGSRVFFATTGFGNASEESADLWVYEVGTGHVRQLARIIDKEKDPSESAQWLEDQQLELIGIVQKRKNDRETAEAAARAREPFRPQAIPIEDGARAYGLRLSPDGRFITFRWMKREGDDIRTRFMEFVNESGQAEAKTARPKVGEPLPDHKMGIVAVDPLKDPDDVEIAWVDDGVDKDTAIHGPYWSPTGTHGVLQILSMDHKDRWIVLLDPLTGKTTELHHEHQDDWIGGPRFAGRVQIVGGRWSPGVLEWLSDGSAFGFVSETTGWAMLYLAEPSGEVTQLTEGEWEVRQVRLSPQDNWYLTTSREHPGEDHLYRLPARGGVLTRITTGEGRHVAVPSPDGGRVAMLFQTPRRLADLYLQDAEPGATRRQVTKSGTDEFYRVDWIDSEIITFSDPKGNPTWARIWEPPKQPSGAGVIHVHGCGECAQGVHKGWLGGVNLYANYLHRKGYVFATLDYRGSTGYGHENRTYAYRQMGVSDVDSGLPLIDILVDRQGVDPRRIGIYGGSYGGFFTIMSLFRHPGVYRAGVALYPVTDWAHYNQGYTSRILNGTPQEDEDAYRQSSPVYYADGLQDALQIQHGLVDNNVQIQDSFRLAQQLLELKKDFDLAVYPVEDHGWDEIPSRRDSYKRMTEWFDRHLLGEVGAGVTDQAGK